MPADGFTPRVYADPSGKTLPYQLLIPPGYDKTQKYPLILSFHGAGERGVNNTAQLPFVARHFAVTWVKRCLPQPMSMESFWPVEMMI